MQDLTVAFAAVTALSATGFVLITVLWLRRMRESVSTTVADATNQQIRTIVRLGDALAHVQKQQRNYEQQLQSHAEVCLRLRQGGYRIVYTPYALINVSNALEHHQGEVRRVYQTLH
jgi:mRNA-degrading endonuclease RelE of RelBE toxin-antitoxin system